MSHRSIGQEQFGVLKQARAPSVFDEISNLIDWDMIAAVLDSLYPATKGEPGWPPVGDV